jgi:hypothetical protein
VYFYILVGVKIRMVLPSSFGRRGPGLVTRNAPRVRTLAGWTMDLRAPATRVLVSTCRRGPAGAKPKKPVDNKRVALAGARRPAPIASGLLANRCVCIAKLVCVLHVGDKEAKAAIFRAAESSKGYRGGTVVGDL